MGVFGPPVRSGLTIRRWVGPLDSISRGGNSFRRANAPKEKAMENQELSNGVKKQEGFEDF